MGGSSLTITSQDSQNLDHDSWQFAGYLDVLSFLKVCILYLSKWLLEWIKSRLLQTCQAVILTTISTLSCQKTEIGLLRLLSKQRQPPEDHKHELQAAKHIEKIERSLWETIQYRQLKDGSDQRHKCHQGPPDTIECYSSRSSLPLEPGATERRCGAMLCPQCSLGWGRPSSHLSPLQRCRMHSCQQMGRNAQERTGSLVPSSPRTGIRFTSLFLQLSSRFSVVVECQCVFHQD